MSYHTYTAGAPIPNEAYAMQSIAAQDCQQSYYYAPPDVPAAHTQLAEAGPPVPSQFSTNWEYDPFSHSEHQLADPPVPSDDLPPLPPMDEAPPLPTEDAPPLPAQPDDVQAQPQQQSAQPDAPLKEQSALANYGQPSLGVAQETVYQPPPMQAQPSDTQAAWPSYQYPVQLEPHPLPQQDPWQQYQYSQPYQAYPQAPSLYQQQPWQLQQQPPPPWQQQPMPAVHPEIAAPHPWQAEAPMQPLPSQAPTLPATTAPASQPPRVVTDIASIFLKPARSSRPKRVSIVLRGLPGSGKSYLAKKMKDVEVEQGGDAPRIHAIDDYFVTVQVHFAVQSLSTCFEFVPNPGWHACCVHVCTVATSAHCQTSFYPTGCCLLHPDQSHEGRLLSSGLLT